MELMFWLLWLIILTVSTVVANDAAAVVAVVVIVELFRAFFSCNCFSLGVVFGFFMWLQMKTMSLRECLFFIPIFLSASASTFHFHFTSIASNIHWAVDIQLETIPNIKIAKSDKWKWILESTTNLKKTKPKKRRRRKTKTWKRETKSRCLYCHH